MSNNISNFSTTDYILFSLSLAVSIIIGIYYSFTRKNVNTTEDFFYGGRKINLFPVIVSILATFFSAIGILGYPAEVYQYGVMIYCSVLNMPIAIPLVAFIYLPILYNLKLGSAYEYLERRFSKAVRQLASIIFLIYTTVHLAVILYAPAVAIYQVTQIPLWLSILGSGIICILYTAFGGIRAVLWTDTFQYLMIVCGLFAVAIKGTLDVGGFSKVWDIAKSNERLYIDFRIDPTIRHTYWSLLIGSSFSVLSMWATNQQILQRYFCVGSLKKSQITLFISTIGFMLTLGLFAYCALTVYAKYYNCDPKLSGKIKNYNQLLPLFVVETLSHVPGLAGLFIASIFCATLSSISSGLNCITAICMEDFIKPYFMIHMTSSIMSEPKALIIAKILALIFGLLCVGFSFLVYLLPDTLLQIVLSIHGVVGGPILAVFTLGILIPCVNSKGAIVGLISSFAITSWISLGAIITQQQTAVLNITTSGCNETYFFPARNESLLWNNSLSFTDAGTSSFSNIYKLSYQYYSLLSLLVALAVAVPVSILTGRQKLENLDPKLIFLPMKPKKHLTLPTEEITNPIIQMSIKDVEENKPLRLRDNHSLVKKFNDENCM